MATDSDISRTQYDNYRYCYDNGHEDWVVGAHRAFEFWKGNQWDASTRRKLENAKRPALTFNIIESLTRSMKGVQRALRNDVRFTPFKDATSEDAAVHDAIWMHIQNANRFEFLETDVFEKGLIFGRAYYDVRVSYDDSFQGNVIIRSPRSQDVLLDPTIETYDPDEWPQVIQRRWVSQNDIRSLYGDAAANAIGASSVPSWYDYEDQLMAQQMGRMPYYRGSPMADESKVRGHLLVERQYREVKRKLVFVDLRTGDMSEVPETWDRNRIADVLRKVPGLSTTYKNVNTVRWVVTCEDYVLHNEDSPYRWFTIVPYFPSFIDGVPSGVVEHLLGAQELFNKITSQELAIINTVANSGYKLKAGSLKNMSVEDLENLGAKPGFVAELENVDDLEKLQPSQTPQGHDRLSFKADKIMRSLAGVSEGSRGFAREDVAGEAILANQAAQDVNFAGWLSNLHRSKQLVAERVRDCVQAHYTETRAIMINRGTSLVPDMQTISLNEPTAEGRTLNDVTRGRYTTTLVPAPVRTTISAEDFETILSLRRDIGIAIPDAMLIELSPAANKAQIIQKLSQDSNAVQQAAAAAEQKRLDEEAKLAAAKTAKEVAAARLNDARAAKAEGEATRDPDASYERIETARIETDAISRAEELRIKEKQVDDNRELAEKELAVKVADLAARRTEAAAARRSQGKPGANKPGNKSPNKGK
jgi:hypothetical protein